MVRSCFNVLFAEPRELIAYVWDRIDSGDKEYTTICDVGVHVYPVGPHDWINGAPHDFSSLTNRLSEHKSLAAYFDDVSNSLTDISNDMARTLCNRVVGVDGPRECWNGFRRDDISKKPVSPISSIYQATVGVDGKVSISVRVNIETFVDLDTMLAVMCAVSLNSDYMTRILTSRGVETRVDAIVFSDGVVDMAHVVNSERIQAYL